MSVALQGTILKEDPPAKIGSEYSSNKTLSVAVMLSDSHGSASSDPWGDRRSIRCPEIEVLVRTQIPIFEIIMVSMIGERNGDSG